MCATTPIGRGLSSRSSAAAKRAPRCTWVRAPNSRTARSPERSRAPPSRRGRPARRRARRAPAPSSTVARGSDPRVELLGREDQPPHPEEVHVSEAEAPGLALLRQLRSVVRQALADEADLPRRRGEPRREIRPLLARVHHRHREVRVDRGDAPAQQRRQAAPGASQITADENPCQTACDTTAQPSSPSTRRYSRGDCA